MSKQEMIKLYFPEEIWHQILLNLPVKSLGKCMCVCKAWNCLIKDTSFISSHLNKQSEYSSRNLFLPQKLWEEPYYLHFDDQEFSKYTLLQLGPLYNHPKKIEVVGSCNGLILLVDSIPVNSSYYLICNPIIRKYVRLPPPILENLYALDFGFGFDSRRNDYKVLRISMKPTSRNVDIELYSLKRNSWKILAPPKYRVFHFCRVVCVNGIVHWIARDSETMYLVLGFDMGDEVYKEIMLPESLRNKYISILPYDKTSSIAVFEEYIDDDCNIWVMKEYGVVETWTKKFSFRRTESIPQLPRVLGFRKNGCLMIESTCKDWEMVSHDVESSKDKIIVLEEKFIYVLSYVESLVLVDANNVISYAAGDEDEATN